MDVQHASCRRCAYSQRRSVSDLSHGWPARDPLDSLPTDIHLTEANKRRPEQHPCRYNTRAAAWEGHGMHKRFRREHLAACSF